MVRPKLNIVIFTKYEVEVNALVEAVKEDLGDDIHIEVAKKRRGGPKGVLNAMIAAIRMLRQQAEKEKKKKQVLLILADPEFVFKGSITRLSKGNVVLLILKGNLGAKKKLTDLSHHHWKWEELVNGTNVEGTAKTKK